MDSDCAGSQHQAGLAGYFIPMALALGSTKHEVVGVELTLLQESVFQVKHPASMAYKRITAGCLGYSVYLGSAVGDWWLNLRFGLSALVAAQVCTPSRAVAIKWRLRVEPPGAERISVRATGLDSCPTSLAPSQKYARSLMPPPPPPRPSPCMCHPNTQQPSHVLVEPESTSQQSILIRRITRWPWTGLEDMVYTVRPKI